MAIIQHKIPIYPNINDIPSTEGGANHPNGSYVTSKYNALIDELDMVITTIQQTGGGASEVGLKTGVLENNIEIYLDTTTGNDNNNGSYESPVLTLGKAIEIANQSNSRQYSIWCSGNTALDLSRIEAAHLTASVPYTLIIHGAQATLSGYIQWVLPANAKLLFHTCTLTSTNAIIQRTNNIFFAQCTFIHSEDAPRFEDCYNLVFESCNFDNSSANSYSDLLSCFRCYVFFEYPQNIPSIDNNFRFNRCTLYASLNYWSGNAINLDLSKCIGIISDIDNSETTVTNIYADSDSLAMIDRTINFDSNIKVGGDKVVGYQNSAIANATIGTEVDTINAILSALRNHGLIAQ